MDFLSSSSEDEKPMGIKSEYDLEDSSSEEDIPVPRSSQKNHSRRIEDLSSALSSVKIGDKPPIKRIPSTKLDTSMLEDSSDDDDDSILNNYKSPFKSKYKPITLDDSDDSLLEEDKSNEKKKSKGPWRFSISKKEYTVSVTSDSAAPNFRIPGHLFDRLYSHQKEGVAWLAGLHAGGVGGLLG
jgi:hypothetical protein